MGEVVIRVKIPKEFEHLRDRIEKTVNKEVEKINLFSFLFSGWL
jgi:hypothetical protein